MNISIPLFSTPLLIAAALIALGFITYLISARLGVALIGCRQRDHGRGGHIRSAQWHGAAKPGALRNDRAGGRMDGVCGSEERIIVLMLIK